MTVRDRIKQLRDMDVRGLQRLFVVVSVWITFLIACGKFLFGVFTPSFFFCLSGLYSACLGVARTLAASAIKSDKHNLDNQRETYAKVILILFAATVVCIAYMIRLFIIPSEFQYQPWISVSMAIFALAELIFAVGGIVQSVRQRDLWLSSLTGINLHGALCAVSLAIVSVCAIFGRADASSLVAVSGIISGGLGMIVCAVMFVVYVKSGKYLKKIKNVAGKRSRLDEFR